MLPRRISQHVNDQNWFAIFIDFIVVVLGIFIGLQVSDWNQERLDRVTEGRYLLALQTDLLATAENIEEVLDETELMRSDLVKLAGLREGGIEAFDKAELDRMIAQGLWDLFALRVQMDAYEDLKFSVGTDLLGNEELRFEFSRLSTELTRYRRAETDMQEVQYRNLDNYLADHFPMQHFAQVFDSARGLPPLGDQQPDYASFFASEKTQNRITMKYMAVSNAAAQLLTAKDSVKALELLVVARLDELGHKLPAKDAN